VPEPLAGGGSDGTARIVVDAQSGYPLAVEHWTSDGDVSGTKIENLVIGGRLPRTFALDDEAEEKLLPMSERFRRMDLRQAAALGARADSPFTPYKPATASAASPAPSTATTSAATARSEPATSRR
jgi:hypothetical protein